ncbi:MAG: type II toxin-antitoxin system Phd/YefM family antitoxin [Elusimicrobiota bacterium]
MHLSLKEDVNSLSFFKANFNKVLHKVKDTHRPMIITQNGRSTGVFMDIETWENQVRKLNLFKLVNEGEMSFKTEKSSTLEEVETYFKRKFDL